MVILTLASLIDTSQWPASSILSGMARHRPLAAISIGSALANLAISIALVQRLGIVGVALGTLIPTAIESAFLMLPYTLRQLGVGAREALAEIALPALVPLGPTLLVLLVWRQAAMPASAIALALIGGTAVAAYAIGYLAVGARAFERQAYGEILRLALRQVTVGIRRLRAG